MAVKKWILGSQMLLCSSFWGLVVMEIAYLWDGMLDDPLMHFPALLNRLFWINLIPLGIAVVIILWRDNAERNDEQVISTILVSYLTYIGSFIWLDPDVYDKTLKFAGGGWEVLVSILVVNAVLKYHKA